MASWVRWSALFAAFWTAGPPVARAECIGPATPCEAFEAATFVFVGTGLDVEVLDPEHLNVDGLDVARRRVRMRVDRSFKGMETRVGQTIEFEEFPHETWIPPKVDERYLIFTGGLQSGLLDMCQNTREFRYSYELPLLERLAAGHQPPALTVVFRSWADVYAPVAGVRYRLRRADRDIIGTTIADGAARFERLEPGKHVLEFAHSEFNTEGKAGRVSFEVGERGCKFASVRLGPNNIVRGRLVDAGGAPVVRGYVSIRGVHESFGKYPPWGGEYSDVQGRFVFRGLLPGEYRLSVPWLRSVGRRRGLTAEQAADKTTAYYPGTLAEDEARIVTVPRVGEVDLGDFRLPNLDALDMPPAGNPAP